MSLFLAIYSEWALALLRVFLGALFMARGFPKLKDLRGAGAAMAKEGLRPGKLFALLFGILESFGGLALVLGILTRPVAALLVLELLLILALRFIHKENFIGKNTTGWELDLTLLGAALVLMTAGGGIWQIGEWLSIFLPW